METFSQLKHLSLLFLLLFTLQLSGCECCFQEERTGLLKIKAFFNTLPWWTQEPNSNEEKNRTNILPSWTDDPNNNCCHWERVNCNTTTGHVVKLSLDLPITWSEVSLDDRILNLSLFHSFERLQHLNLSYNQFNGLSDHILGIKSFARLKELKILDLSYNHFRNSVLPFVSAATSLRVLDIGFNKMEGAFHPEGLGYLRDLRMLFLGGNNLNDTNTQLLQVFPNLTNLEVLDLGINQFHDYRLIQGICELTHLQELNLRFNDFTSVPHCLGNLTHLRTLELSYNQLHGSSTVIMSKMPPSLEYLSLFRNNFEGSLLFSSLINQTRLKVFSLSSNLGTMQFLTDGSWVPPFQLKAFQLQNFDLGNEIPNFLLHQYDLRILDLACNKLVGVFPSWILKNNTKLKYISLRNNSLTEFSLSTYVHKLLYLDLSNNKIVGFLHRSIGKIFPNLSRMNISQNGFEGVVPSSMGQMKGLEMLDMASNSLSGELPRNFLSGCGSLRFLKLSDNYFQGQIFPEYSNLTDLLYLYLDGNNFSGIGNGLLKSTSLKHLTISNNMLSGKIPSWIGRLSQLEFLSMMKNQIEGVLPSQLLNIYSLKVLDISDNKLTGPMPGNTNFSSIRDLRLQNNGLVGSIPDALFEFPSLEMLDLRNNSLVGKIPKSIGKQSEIRALLLQKNRLQGDIPSEICQLKKANFLDLSYNRLTGFIPSCLGNISFNISKDWWIKSFGPYNSWVDGSPITFDDIYASSFHPYADGNFHVSYPTIIVKFSTKKRYDPFQGDILHQMVGLDLSSNELSGEIPYQVGDIQNIRSLNLSHNRLIGLIPESISKLENIESLDLSYNRLNGKIPAQLAELDGLGDFNVSYNNLWGPIPYTGHLTTFDGTSYIGNANLCGKPTTKICDPTKMPNSLATQKEDDGGVIDMVWFYWSFGATFVMILVGLLAFLCIDSHWSKEWFYRVDLVVYHLQRLSMHPSSSNQVVSGRNVESMKRQFNKTETEQQLGWSSL